MVTNSPYTSGRHDHIAALLLNGKDLIAGGFNTGDTGPSTELFDPAGNCLRLLSFQQD